MKKRAVLLVLAMAVSGVATEKSSAQDAGCDPAYPDVCIPPPAPRLGCDDVPYRRFRVLFPDPHGFDADGDGLGCEREWPA